MKKRTEAELTTIVWSQINRAADYSNNALSNIRRKAWDYYLCRKRGDEIKGRSQVVDTIIRDTHNALMSTIMPSYATDHVVQFEPVDEGDEDQANSETDAVNNIFTEDNSGYMELSNAVSDALLFRNGIIKVWVEAQDEKTVLNYPPDAPAAQVEVGLKRQGYTVESTKESAEGIAFTVSRETEKLRVMAVEPANFITDQNQPDMDLQKARFMAERVVYTRGMLSDLGVPDAKIELLDELTDEGVTQSGATSTDVMAKFQDAQPTHERAQTYAEERVECYWVHMLIDGEKWRFLASNDILLQKDPVAYFPYAAGSGLPVPHRFSGQGLYDILKETQDTLTNVRRQFIDNLNHCNNGEIVYDPVVTNPEDVRNRAPGRAIQSKDPVTGVNQLAVVDVSTQSLAAIAHFRDLASQQAGSALDMATAEAQSVKDVSGLSVEMQLAPKEQMASHISRNLAETLVRNTFLLIHRALREDFSGSIKYRLRDQWVETRPSEWRPRTRINVTVGLSPGDRRRRRASLESVMRYQMELIAGGAANIAVDYKGLHNCLSDWLKASELDGAEGYFIDPLSEQSQQAQQNAAREQEQQSQIMEALQQLQIQMEQAKLREDQRQHDTELQFKYWAEQVKADIKEAEIVENGIQARVSANSGMGGAQGADRENGAAGGAQN